MACEIENFWNQKKICRTCKTEKLAVDFGFRCHNWDRLTPDCKECHNANERKKRGKKYGGWKKISFSISTKGRF